MNIAIIEKGHFEVAFTLLRFFDNGQNNITIYLEPISKVQLDLTLGDEKDNINWFCQDNDEPNRAFIDRMFADIKSKKYDLLYISTISDNFSKYAKHLKDLPLLPNVMAIHDINSFFAYRISRNLRTLVRFLGRQQLLKQIQSYNVLGETLKLTLAVKLKEAKKIWNISGGFFDNHKYKNQTWEPGQEIRIGIPGSVDSRRRDYFQAFQLLSLARQKELNIRLFFIGSFDAKHSKTIRQQADNYLAAHDDLVFYGDTILPQPDFDQILSGCHFIWSPMQPSSVMGEGVIEQYGISTCSGNMADVIRHARPWIIPSFLRIDKALEPCSIPYKDLNELLEFIFNLTVDSYNNWQARAVECCSHFTIDAIRTRNSELLQN